MTTKEVATALCGVRRDYNVDPVFGYRKPNMVVTGIGLHKDNPAEIARVKDVLKNLGATNFSQTKNSYGYIQLYFRMK